MEIRKTLPEDLEKLLTLFADARQFMKENGNPAQWGDSYPPISLLEADIQSGNSYVAVDGGEIAGTFYFAPGPDPTYEVIKGGNWENDTPYWVMHRVAAGRNRRGVASFCIQWCLQKEPHIRIDTHRDNLPMQKALAKNGFSYRGIIRLANGAERLAYEQTK